MQAFWYIVIAILLRIRRHFWCVEMDVVEIVLRYVLYGNRKEPFN
jgi:hypothetical protein